MVYVLLCWGVFFLFSQCTPQWSIVWGLNFFSSSLSSCKCCIFLTFPVFLFCLPRCHMYVVYVWTGWWLISLVLFTSDNKGLLLLLLTSPVLAFFMTLLKSQSQTAISVNLSQIRPTSCPHGFHTGQVWANTMLLFGVQFINICLQWKLKMCLKWF